jgi:phage shock protein A
MNDDTNLGGMDYETAREYVLGFMTSLKQVEQELATQRAELETWTKRAELASSKGMAELQAQALAQAEIVAAKLPPLEAERADLASKIEAMRGQLPMLKATERSVDPDALLANLQMATGEYLEPEKTAARQAEASIRELGADSALEELKRKLGMAPAPDSSPISADGAPGEPPATNGSDTP